VKFGVRNFEWKDKITGVLKHRARTELEIYGSDIKKKKKKNETRVCLLFHLFCGDCTCGISGTVAPNRSEAAM
jgi:hypothetical protein